jgi:hypothetical protein
MRGCPGACWQRTIFSKNFSGRSLFQWTDNLAFSEAKPE